MFLGISNEWLDLIDTDSMSGVEAAVDAITPAHKLCPPKHKWFEFARLTKLEAINTIIIGQDPYFTEGMAHGLAFSSLHNRRPPSLMEIYKCMVAHGALSKIPNTADLTSWAKQGVLLYNIALTTEVDKANAHSHLWAIYSSYFITRLSDYGKVHGKVYTFMLWGKNAQTLARHIDGTHHKVLKWRHPSPLANTYVTDGTQFMNCTHFNESSVDWDVINRQDMKGMRIDTSIQSEYHAVFTDGACKQNGSIKATGSYAAIFVGGPLTGIAIYGKLKNKYPATNIRAEGMAILKVLRHLRRTEDTLQCDIYTDSEFWKRMIENYMPSWGRESFEYKANADITKAIWALWREVSMTRTLHIVHIYAHNKSGWKNSSDPYKRWCYKNNAAVDALATKVNNA